MDEPYPGRFAGNLAFAAKIPSRVNARQVEPSEPTRPNGSVASKLIIPVIFLGLWSAAVVYFQDNVALPVFRPLSTGLFTFMLTVSLGYHTTTGHARYLEARRSWNTLLSSSRSIARIIWVHVHERHDRSSELGKKDLTDKLAAIDLLNTFAIALKHRLRFEPLLTNENPWPPCFLPTIAHDFKQTISPGRGQPWWRSFGQWTGTEFLQLTMIERIEELDRTPGNTPFEVLEALATYMEIVVRNQRITPGPVQMQWIFHLSALTDAMTSAERALRSPPPVGITTCVTRLAWLYLLGIPFMFARIHHYMLVPGLMAAGFLMFYAIQVGRELRYPYGNNVNHLPIDDIVRELARDIRVLTSRPAPLDGEIWSPFSTTEEWERRSLAELRRELHLRGLEPK